MPPTIPITDPDDPRIAAYRHVREPDLVCRTGRFIAEGEVVLRVLLTASRQGTESLLIADNRLAALPNPGKEAIGNSEPNRHESRIAVKLLRIPKLRGEGSDPISARV